MGSVTKKYSPQKRTFVVQITRKMARDNFRSSIGRLGKLMVRMNGLDSHVLPFEMLATNMRMKLYVHVYIL